MNGTAAGLLALIMWVFSTMLFAFISTVPPLQLTAMVYFTGFLMMTLWQLARGEDMEAYWRRPLSDYAFWLGTFGVYTILIFIALRTVPVFEGFILNNLWVVLLIVFSALINKIKVTALHITGGLLGFAGVVAIFAPSQGMAFFSDFHFGHFLALVAALIWALYSALARRVSYPMGFFGPVFLVFSAICLALHLLFEQTVLPGGFEWMVVLMMGLFRVSYVLWDYSMKKGDVLLLASLSYFLPLATSLGLWLIGAGPARPMIGVGAAMIVAACILVNYRDLSRLAARVRA